MRSTDTTSTITSSRAWVLPFVAVALVGAGPGPSIRPIERAPAPAGEAGDAQAIALRAADLVALDLARLGAPIWPRPAAGALAGRGHALSVDAALDGEKLALTVRGIGEPAVVSGRLEELDLLACRAARKLAPAAGLTVPDGAELLLGGVDPAPSMVHLALGHAALDLASGQWQRGRMRFGRVEEVWRGALLPEALEGVWLAQIRGASQIEAQVASSEELARAALEKADFAARGPDRGVPALGAALRFWTDRALAWAAPVEPAVPLDPGAKLWWLADRALEPRTGAVVAEARGSGRRIGEIGADLLRLDGGTLVRADLAGKPRWSRALPWKEAEVELGALAGGFVAVRGAKGLAWIDASTGVVAQADASVVVRAVGLDGALVETAPGKIALVRPGRKAQAWSGDGPAGARWRMVAGRAIALDGQALRVTDTHDGKPRGAALAVPAGAGIIAADGRFAVIAAGNEVVIVDVLGAAEISRLRGPAEAVVAASGDSGLAIGFASGDVFYLDRDGAYVDRARLFGHPIAAWSGRPHAPGFLLRTDAGLFALGPVPSAERPRDVELMLMLAWRLEGRGDRAGALRWAERVALSGAGRIADAEGLRARLLEADKRAPVARARAAAARRAAAAEDRSIALPPFDLD